VRNPLKKICVALAILAVMACADCANRASAAEQGAIRVAGALASIALHVQEPTILLADGMRARK
jgi:hypothetical protein